MESFLSLTVHQVDTVERSLNRAMAIAQVLAKCCGENQHMHEPPEAMDLFLIM